MALFIRQVPLCQSSLSVTPFSHNPTLSLCLEAVSGSLTTGTQPECIRDSNNVVFVAGIISG